MTMDLKTSVPEWIPENYDKKVAGKVVEGCNAESTVIKNKLSKRHNQDVESLAEGISSGNMALLSKAITLIESNSSKHLILTQELLRKILPLTGKSIRIGITGPPGAGKSTFIESLGNFLVDSGLKVAVLAIDPSSTVTKGSILGDKTRMELLSRKANAFIRPSPSGGNLGGVARKTRETILACEAAGFNIILIETIGVGQSEITVRSIVDVFLLLLLPGSGDELQGIKKGVVELTDILVINKADGNYKDRANLTMASYKSALNLLHSPTEGWKPQVMSCSAINNQGIDKIWSVINEFIINTKSSGIFSHRRNEQLIKWLYGMLDEYIFHKYLNNKKFKAEKNLIESELLAGNTTTTEAFEKLTRILGL